MYTYMYVHTYVVRPYYILLKGWPWHGFVGCLYHPIFRRHCCIPWVVTSKARAICLHRLSPDPLTLRERRRIRAPTAWTIRPNLQEQDHRSKYMYTEAWTVMENSWRWEREGGWGSAPICLAGITLVFLNWHTAWHTCMSNVQRFMVYTLEECGYGCPRLWHRDKYKHGHMPFD